MNQVYQKAPAHIRAGEIEALRLLLDEHPGLAMYRPDSDERGAQNTLLHEVTGMGEVSWTPQAPAITTLRRWNGPGTASRPKWRPYWKIGIGTRKYFTRNHRQLFLLPR